MISIKDRVSLSLTFFFQNFLFFKNLSLFNLLCHINIFVGVLRDSSIPMTPPALVLSPSQTRPFHYLMNILSTMEPLSDEYLDEDQDVNDLYNVSSLQSLVDIYY